MDPKLKLEIATPEALAWSGEADLVTLPGREGELGVFPEHTPLLLRIRPGPVCIRQGRQELYLVVGEGFASVTATEVVVLTARARPVQNLVEARAAPEGDPGPYAEMFEEPPEEPSRPIFQALTDWREAA